MSTVRPARMRRPLYVLDGEDLELYYQMTGQRAETCTESLDKLLKDT
jgi:hypothetical protein